MSHFFAYLSRMRLIKRWGLMHSVYPENIQEHSLQVGMLAHALAVINRDIFDGDCDPNQTAVLAIYHDASEVITGDLPTPIKYFNPKIKEAYKEVEAIADDRLHKMLPQEIQDSFASIFNHQPEDAHHWKLVKAADKISAYLKCMEELMAGNREFSNAKTAIETSIAELALPEVDYFMEHFIPSFALTLDELD